MGDGTQRTLEVQASGTWTPVDVADLTFFPVVKRPVQVHAHRMHDAFRVKTLEGIMDGGPGDYLLRGVEGEYYPVDAAIFGQTYLDDVPDDGDLDAALQHVDAASMVHLDDDTRRQNAENALAHLVGWLAENDDGGLTDG